MDRTFASRFFGFRCLVFAISLILVLAILAVVVPPHAEQMSYLRAYHDKQQRLQNRDDAAIVLVGGSGTAFGYDSRRLSQTTGRDVINTGLHAGLGADWITRNIGADLRANDIVLLSLEYELLQSTAVGSRTLAAMLIDVDPSTLRHIPPWDQPRIIDDAALYIGQKTVFFVTQWANRWVGRSIQSTDTVYRREGFNRWGDVDAHWGLATKTFPVSNSIPPTRIDTGQIKRLAQIVQRWRRRGVKVLVLPPACDASSFDASRAFIERLSKTLKRHDIGYAIPPETLRMDRSFFYDTCYHLTHDGAIERLRRLIDQLPGLTKRF